MGFIAIFHRKMAWHKIMTCYFCIIEDARIDLTIFYCNYHKTMGIELCSPLIYKFRPLHHFIWISNIKTKLYSAKISPHDCLLSLSFQSVPVVQCPWHPTCLPLHLLKYWSQFISKHSSTPLNPCTFMTHWAHYDQIVKILDTRKFCQFINFVVYITIIFIQDAPTTERAKWWSMAVAPRTGKQRNLPGGRRRQPRGPRWAAAWLGPCTSWRSSTLVSSETPSTCKGCMVYKWLQDICCHPVFMDITRY